MDKAPGCNPAAGKSLGGSSPPPPTKFEVRMVVAGEKCPVCGQAFTEKDISHSCGHMKIGFAIDGSYWIN